MVELRETPEFTKWMKGVRDKLTKHVLVTRLMRLANGLPGDVKPVGRGVSELRVDFGPGYRIYFCQRGSLLIILLGGGTKRTQEKDIPRAMTLAEEYQEESHE